MLSLLNGMNTMGFLVIALFFVRFWHRTSDPLFATFAAAFLLLGLHQLSVGLSVAASEHQSLLYLLRLAAFALLIVAIVWKNLGSSPGKNS